MTDAGTTQDYFILPALRVGGLSISQDDRMKLVRNRTIPIILPSRKNILVNVVFKVNVGTPTLTRGKSKAEFAAESAFSLPLMPTWPGTQIKVMSLLTKCKKTHYRITISIK